MNENSLSSSNEIVAKRIDVEGNDLNYLESGTGEVILLLHGITTYSFMWRNIIPGLAAKYRVIALDLLGCGDSGKPLDVEYSLKNHARIISLFLKKLGIGKVHLAGHDLGGGIAQIMAVNEPELFYDVTLINCVAYDYWPVQPIIAMRTPIIRQMAMATLDLGSFRMIVSRGIFNKGKVTDELMDYFWRPMRTSEGRKAFLHFAHCLNNKDLLDISGRLHSLEIPFLLIRGDGDLYLSRDIIHKLEQNLKKRKLVIIKEAGHFINEDCPELLIENILNFTSSHDKK